MTDLFTQAVTREVAQLFAQQNQQIGNFSPDSASADPIITPQQVLEVMQGNPAWLEEWESELEERFRRVADRALDYWMEHTDKEIRASLSVLEGLVSSGEENLAGNASGSSTGLFSRRLTSLANRGTKKLFNELFNRTRTNIQETERSQESSRRYKASRGQAQAELSKELSRGKRYT